MSSEKPISKNEQQVFDCLAQLIKIIGAESPIKIEFGEPRTHIADRTINVFVESGDERGMIIGKRGQNINAINTILKAVAKRYGVVFGVIQIMD